MKKTICILLVAILGISAGFAQKSYSINDGYKGNVEVGVMHSFRQGEGFSALTTHGFQINPHVFVGGGIGINFLGGDNLSVPLFADFKYYLLDGKVSPFVNLRLGYAFGDDDYDLEGFYLTPALGCRVALSKNIGLNMSLGCVAKEHGGVYVNFGFDF